MRKGVVNMLGASLAFSFMQLCVKYLPHLPAVELVFFSLISKHQHLYSNDEKTKT